MIAVVVWLVLIGIWWLIVLPLLRRGPRDPQFTFLWLGVRAFAKFVHRTRFVGRTIVPQTNRPGPLIVVANHTGAVDPFIVSAGCQFNIRWMMAEDMMSPKLQRFLDYAWVIPVSRDGKDTSSAREAVRLLKQGEVIGIFPEGGITTPPRQIMPFFAGVGLIIARSKAPVLLTWISGTPDTNDMMKSLATPSHARVQYVAMLDFTGERDPKVITETLRQKLAEVSGWPMVDGDAVPRLVEQAEKSRNEALDLQPG